MTETTACLDEVLEIIDHLEDRINQSDCWTEIECLWSIQTPLLSMMLRLQNERTQS